MTRKQTISKVLELKEFTQEQLDAEVKKAGVRLSAEKEKLERLERTLIRSEEKFKGKQDRGALHVSEVGLFYDYLSYLGRQIEAQKGVLFRLNAEFEMRKKEMLEVYKEKRVFEKFRDKIVYEENRRALLVEQNEADYHFISKKLRK